MQQPCINKRQNKHDELVKINKYHCDIYLFLYRCNIQTDSNFLAVQCCSVRKPVSTSIYTRVYFLFDSRRCDTREWNAYSEMQGRVYEINMRDIYRTIQSPESENGMAAQPMQQTDAMRYSMQRARDDEFKKPAWIIRIM